MKMDAADIPSVLRSIKHETFSENEIPRREALLAARALCAELEKPAETLLRICWEELTLQPVLRVAYDMGLFQKLSQCPQSTEQLAEKTGCEVILMERILRHLAAMHIVHEAGSGMYHANRFSAALAAPLFGDGIPFSFEFFLKGFAKLPEYFATAGCKLPADPNAMFQSCMNTSHTGFEYIFANPKIATTFNNHMGTYASGRPTWHEYFPIESKLLEDKGADGVPVLVDVGGGRGQDAIDLLTVFPRVQARCVVQDLPHVISEMPEDWKGSIEAMEHDFFTPQPIKGARLYYMHSILHDWPDEKCREILRQLTPAMKSGYSSLLINENVIPDRGAGSQGTALDIFMMYAFGALERTEVLWRNLFESVGMRIVGIWRPEAGLGADAVMEVELAG